MSRVGTNNPDHTLTPHYLAVAAQLFYRCPDFHNDLQLKDLETNKVTAADSRKDYLDKPMPPPVRLAFLSRLSYWCDIRCDCTWAMKSMHTTTIISKDVPPK